VNSRSWGKVLSFELRTVNTQNSKFKTQNSLLKTDEICGQTIVEGWRVVVSDGRQSWVYRTNSRGNILRLEPKKA
jgi:hypothetical protein